jgi:PAS domain S-box-containing protein
VWETLDQFFGQGFMPHGHCYLWTPSLVWAEVGSNLLIGLAYASIAATLTILVRRIRNIPFAFVYLAFGVFILSCGLTHFLDIVTVWHPIYWADAGVRILTAVSSAGTAILIVPLVPRAVALAETARLSDDRRRRLEEALDALERANAKLASREREAVKRALVSEGQFQSLVETMPQLAWLSAPDGTSLYRNGGWRTYTGLDLAELEARGWLSVVDPALVDGVEAQWRHALDSGAPFDTDCRLRGSDGEYRWFVARALPLRDDEGAIVRWIGTCTNIDEQRRSRDEAVRIARLKDEFLATVSHELRTPLNAILGWSRLLRTDAVPEAKRAKALETVERNAAAQAQLIDDLLDISRIVSGNLRLDVGLIGPATAVAAAIESVRPAAVAKGVQLEVTIDEHAGPLMADAMRLQQIVWNLVINAVKFTPPGGRVAVTLRRSDENIELAVTDTGIGIGRPFLRHVFDRFSQEDGSIRRAQGGLGLGLAIVKHLVELHGATVAVESLGEGRGATFVVSFPVGRPDGARGDVGRPLELPAEPRPLQRPVELRDLRVLLVEDDADARELFCVVLEQCGAVVTSAGNAEDALALLLSRTFNVILSDIGLPSLDGYDFMKAVRALPAHARVPAAALTAYAHADDRRRALDAGYQMHLPKPVEPHELIAVVASLARLAAFVRS